MRRTQIALFGTALVAIGVSAASVVSHTAHGSSAIDATATRSSTDSSARSSSGAEATYDGAVDAARSRTKRAAVMADVTPGSWSRRADVASAELGYARLTGDYEAYERAERSLDEAFRIARASIDDPASGPLLLRASLDYELHRLDVALERLDAPARRAEALGDQPLSAEVQSLRGAVTFAMGRYDEGLGMMRRSVELDPSAPHKQRLALALAKVGQHEEADRILAETEPLSKTPLAQAWVSLERGKIALAHGRHFDGRKHLERAQLAFPGYWVTEELLAHVDTEEGNKDRAIETYRALVERTGAPELMDHLAALIAEQAPEEAQALLDRSDRIYEDRLARLPEVTYGHALEHYLRWAPDAERAVELAEKNVAQRPNGEARTLLAQAYIRAGRIREAWDESQRVVGSKWVSADAFATAAVAARLADDPAATELEEAANGINHHAMREIAWLVPRRASP